MNVLQIAFLSFLIIPQAIFASAPARQSMGNPQTSDFTKLSKSEQYASTCCCICCFVPALIMTNEDCNNAINEGYTLATKTSSRIRQFSQGKQYIKWPKRPTSPRSAPSKTLPTVNEEPLGYKSN